jgi:hypothetical protein
MSSMRFNARLDTSHHGPPHLFKDAGVVSDSLTVKCLFVVSRCCVHKGLLGVPTGRNQEDSNLEAVQWVLLYLVMLGVAENTWHSRAKMCRSTIMHSFSYNSQTNVSRHMLLWTLFFCMWKLCPNVAAPFTYTLCSLSYCSIVK